MERTIQVTQADIDQDRKYRAEDSTDPNGYNYLKDICTHCALAQAFKRQGFPDVYIGCVQFWPYGAESSETRAFLVRMPIDMAVWRERNDRNPNVAIEPATFVVDIPDRPVIQSA